eukprot:490897_1
MCRQVHLSYPIPQTNQIFKYNHKCSFPLYFTIIFKCFIVKNNLMEGKIDVTSEINQNETIQLKQWLNNNRLGKLAKLIENDDDITIDDLLEMNKDDLQKWVVQDLKLNTMFCSKLWNALNKKRQKLVVKNDKYELKDTNHSDSDEHESNQDDGVLDNQKAIENVVMKTVDASNAIVTVADYANASVIQLVCGFIRNIQISNYLSNISVIIPSSIIELCIQFYYIKLLNLRDFHILKIIGKGAFAEIRTVRNKHNGVVYALKSWNKEKDVINKKQIWHTFAERNLMILSKSKWLVELLYTFQDNQMLYMVMEYCQGGDFMAVLMRKDPDTLTEQQMRFYIAELATAINEIHKLGFIHRDIKPDNIYITKSGHVKLGDFGLSCTYIDIENSPIIAKNDGYIHEYKNDKDTKKHRERKLVYSTVGTPDYIAPEVFRQKGYDHSIDFWSMGVILFEGLLGYPPFYAEDPLQTCRKIFHYRQYFKIPFGANLSSECIDLLNNLICSCRRRYGYSQIIQHEWFKNIQFNDLLSMKPPFIPTVKSDDDTSYFDDVSNFESEHNINSTDEFRSSTFYDKNHFWGWDYHRDMLKRIKKDIFLQNKMKEMREWEGDKQREEFVNEYKKCSKCWNNYDMTIEMNSKK